MISRPRGFLARPTGMPRLIVARLKVTTLGHHIILLIYLFFSFCLFSIFPPNRCTLQLYHRPTADRPVIIPTVLRSQPQVSTLQQLPRCDG